MVARNNFELVLIMCSRFWFVIVDGHLVMGNYGEGDEGSVN